MQLNGHLILSNEPLRFYTLYILGLVSAPRNPHYLSTQILLNGSFNSFLKNIGINMSTRLSFFGVFDFHIPFMNLLKLDIT